MKQANDACAAEGRKLAATAVQMKERHALIQSLRKENKSLSVANDKLGKRLHRAEHRYDILSKSKLGKLTLAYWRWKSGVKTDDKNCANACPVPSHHVNPPSPLPQETWEQQRENERRYFAK